ncbi:unnamed protein product [Rhizoctonia solani]|uniref:Uncharacterized protein n=1 Tax=Rhizoctonia solani TaxID=456999 RepID=A0A8H2ZZ68_9AGAM|nr:unnamed protein product [Rhizoctonia solani]
MHFCNVTHSRYDLRTDVWVYGPPSSQLTRIPPDYKIYFYENYRFSSRHQCYQTNVTAAYLARGDEDEPVVVFAQGQLQNHHHRIEISVADPTNDIRDYDRIKFSHVVYTTVRPTRWPVKEDHWRYREIVMHDTHPLLSYSPPVSSSWFSTSPWSAKLYTAEDGTVTSWHELKSYKEPERDQWGVETKIKAGAGAVYGTPRAYIKNLDNLGLVCIRLDMGLCQVVDVETIYLNRRDFEQYEPVLLWYNDALDPSHETRISIRLVKTPYESMVVFTSFSEYGCLSDSDTSPEQLASDLQNMTIGNDDGRVLYNPGRRCDSYGMLGG